ncbi:type II toxin-antitoxin system Phd/YefM family antitoxin [Thiohalorhabdus sp. Cl-TMA]|uniref:Antitoxin n=1 Tax=Thiohalorhabdus methylotrophus TaxID=3242694 RepID=A0ABV4TYJ5_9GAMM
MKIIDSQAAQTHLFRLLEEVQKGDSFIIAKAGRPVARVTSVEAPQPVQTGRLGFMAGQIAVPEDFDRMGEEKMRSLFRAGADS